MNTQLAPASCQTPRGAQIRLRHVQPAPATAGVITNANLRDTSMTSITSDMAGPKRRRILPTSVFRSTHVIASAAAARSALLGRIAARFRASYSNGTPFGSFLPVGSACARTPEAVNVADFLARTGVNPNGHSSLRNLTERGADVFCNKAGTSCVRYPALVCVGSFEWICLSTAVLWPLSAASGRRSKERMTRSGAKKQKIGIG